jgi:hypothetical protein
VTSHVSHPYKSTDFTQALTGCKWEHNIKTDLQEIGSKELGLV